MNNWDIYSKKPCLGLIPHECTESNSFKRNSKALNRVLRIPQWILFSAIWNWPQEIHLINCQKIKKRQNIIYTPFLSHEWIWQSYISICKLSLLIISIRVHLNSLMSMIMGQYILRMGAIMRKSIIVSSNLVISDLNWYFTTK